MISSFSPALFDALVIVTIAAGLFLVVRRLRNDFRRGPRWPEDKRMWYLPPEETEEKDNTP